ncbi:DUF421 domain-containing protein [Chryseobacterium salipaludis]|uniref:DUF421 domain-containing protein n=1 Tax=Chryseobacterium TaxID=59732 RepID=UPI000E986B03|nr:MULTISPECIES: YetF domain-containing protein [Chryseobacterium]MCJ8498320.1 DUF421 domain-containing protein [Chryseobacterium salipaludis]MCX3297434.1 DUF421 domain-containing protein [Planobacterium sp. JC490]HAV02892.1 DUF421 domain-containing protein [Chryseobacterium sp.]
MDKIFFDSWESIVRTIIITILAYISLVILLRISGKRTLSKMNAFDFIVTVALGSTLASVLLTKDVALADGVLAFILLIGLQYIITKLAVKSKTVSQLVKGQPSLLVYNGELLHRAMLKERVNRDEIYAALRENGVSALSNATAVILETDGSLTVLSSDDNEKPETLSTVQTWGKTSSE